MDVVAGAGDDDRRPRSSRCEGPAFGGAIASGLRTLRSRTRSSLDPERGPCAVGETRRRDPTFATAARNASSADRRPAARSSASRPASGTPCAAPHPRSSPSDARRTRDPLGDAPRLRPTKMPELGLAATAEGGATRSRPHRVPTMWLRVSVTRAPRGSVRSRLPTSPGFAIRSQSAASGPIASGSSRTRFTTSSRNGSSIGRFWKPRSFRSRFRISSPRSMRASSSFVQKPSTSCGAAGAGRRGRPRRPRARSRRAPRARSKPRASVVRASGASVESAAGPASAPRFDGLGYANGRRSECGACAFARRSSPSSPFSSWRAPPRAPRGPATPRPIARRPGQRTALHSSTASPRSRRRARSWARSWPSARTRSRWCSGVRGVSSGRRSRRPRRGVRGASS